MNTSTRTQIRRSPSLADHERATLHEILDAAWLCQVAFHDGASTHCIPTACWRSGEHLYIHGSNGSRLIRVLLGGAQACVNVTHLDGLVLARAAFNHTMNYRSAVIYGQFERHADTVGALDLLMEKLAPGRAAQVRPGNAQEVAATTVLRIALDEAVCKVRRGGPKDDAEDLALPVWAGHIPLTLTRGAAIADA
ncbi:pyridoxamine 5'-phosphate oxidase family protein [Massilia sp. TS11]|uniref:pyridoxamine 5'-phosphate oxidase family protein n=1 Tax=Massilia sp. TS11 TaxID=2908003 RepID=UPI0035A3499D